MSLSRADLEKLARLAALQLNEQELESLRADLEQILDYVAQLDALDTSGVEPLSHPTIDLLRERADEPLKRLQREDVLSNAPEVLDDLFKVPAVLDRGD